MAEYVCLKPCTLFGVQYLPEQTIPAEAVLPARERALLNQKVIGRHNPHEPPAFDGIQLPEGALNDVQRGDLQAAIHAALDVMGKEEAEVVAAVGALDNLLVLECVGALDTRTAVLEAVGNRRTALNIPDNSQGDPAAQAAMATASEVMALGAVDAAKAVAALEDSQVLAYIGAEDSRKTVLDAVEARKKMLTPMPEDISTTAAPTPGTDAPPPGPGDI